MCILKKRNKNPNGIKEVKSVLLKTKLKEILVINSNIIKYKNYQIRIKREQ